MNALKKAENAKQAGENAPSDTAVPAALETGRNLAQELGLDPPAARKVGANSDEALSVKPEPAPLLRPMELALEPESAPVSAAPVAPPVRDASGGPPRRARSAPDADRSAARAVFSAKQPAGTDSKAPFYSLIGLCLLGGAAYGFYLWMQMQPPARAPVAAAPASQNRPIANTADAANAASAAIAPTAATESQLPATDSGSTLGSAPRNNTAPGASGTPDDVARPSGLPGPVVRRESAPPAPQNSSPSTGPYGQADAASAAGGAAVASLANLRITRNANVPTVNPDVLSGYAALQSGDLDRAGRAYDSALRSEPANRDALLGAATVLLRLDRTDAAEAYFRQLLRLHPNDTYATAQLAALTARGDPVGALSQVNSLIAREAERPESATGNGSLAFVQGNQLAAQGRWPEAQQAYFNAHRADPTNADYCYNLAISLDRMHEPRLARDFYSKAIDLARGRATGFDLTRAQTRLSQIDSSLK